MIPASTADDLQAMARTVREFYEANPYPRPQNNLDRDRANGKEASRLRAEFHLFWPTTAYRADRTILVAGCGTSQAAKYALRYPGAKVVGIDVSARSIGETEKLKRSYGLTNLELLQLPVERAAEIGQPFDQIVSTGVLHHLPDPVRGLRALRDVLAPEGAMHLMVYAPYGRAGVYMMQDYCRRLGIGTTPSAVRDLANSLGALPPDHPLVPLLRDAPDFRSYAGVADALLNPQDRPYSVPQLFELIRDGGLKFGRWLRQAPYLPECGAPASTAHAKLLRVLPDMEQYAAVELFRGTMVRHSVILFRDDFSKKAQPIHFEGDAWLDYVPIRMPDTVSIEEGLPAGVAAALVNRNHPYPDLNLPIDGQEKKMFGAIDGVRSIGRIAHPQSSTEPARSFFKKLWLYDQVGFDDSASVELASVEPALGRCRLTPKGVQT